MGLVEGSQFRLIHQWATYQTIKIKFHGIVSERFAPSTYPFFFKKSIMIPHGPPSDYPPRFGFAANHMRHSFINTVLGGDVLSISPHLRHDAKATLKDHANSLSAELLLESTSIPPRLPGLGLRFPHPVFDDDGRSFPILALRGLICRNPTGSEMGFRRFSRIFGKLARNCASEISRIFFPRLGVF